MRQAVPAEQVSPVVVKRETAVPHHPVTEVRPQTHPSRAQVAPLAQEELHRMVREDRLRSARVDRLQSARVALRSVVRQALLAPQPGEAEARRAVEAALAAAVVPRAVAVQVAVRRARC
jgi:hypothetical protein